MHLHLHCSCNSSTNMGDIVRKKFCQTKITDFRIEVLIQQYVACFDISVNNVWLSLFVKKS